MTGGVVRRDGLREAVGRWLYERDWSGDIEGWDDPDTDRDEYLDQADDLLSRVLDAVPDVPPQMCGKEYRFRMTTPGVRQTANCTRDEGHDGPHGQPLRTWPAVPDVPPDVRPEVASPNKPGPDVRTVVPPDPPAVEVSE